MAQAWDRGERVSASEIMGRFPDIPSEAAIRLIYEEVCLHREAGLPVDTDEVVRRHPRWSEKLQAMLECDRLLRPSGTVISYPEVGEALGPFLLLTLLGKGASGRTFLATDPTLANRPVVVKVVPDDQEEHLALAQLRHTHIVPLFSEHSFPDRNLRGLCMPYLGGTTLLQVFEDLAGVPWSQRTGKLIVELIDKNTHPAPALPRPDGPFRRSLEEASHVEAVTWITACLAEALHYAHERGFVHMDLKPSNVLITLDGQPMLLDFHLAPRPILAGQWVSDRLGGTHGWMSPEQEAAMEAVVKGRPVPRAVDGRSDIYALGLLLREALELPSANEAEDGFDPRFSRQANVELGLADIVNKCLANDPAARYQNAGLLAEDLRRQLNDLPLRGVRNRSILERWRKWRRRHPGALAWGVAASAVLLASSLILAVFLERTEQLRIALEDGRAARASQRYDDAIRTLKRGLDDAAALPAAQEWRKALHSELVLTQHRQLTAELHELANRIRFHYGVELPGPEEARSVSRLCKAIWDRRAQLLSATDSDRETTLHEQIATDLLELAVINTDLLIDIAPSGQLEPAKSEALRILAEAEHDFGRSFAIDGRRRHLLSISMSPEQPAEQARKPQTAWEHYDHGRYCLRTGKIEAAALEFLATLELRPQDFWSNFYNGLCAFRLRKFNDAVAAFHTCIALTPNSATCYYNRGLANRALGRESDAYRDYSKALELEPGLEEARLNRGILLYEWGRYREAIADYEQAITTCRDRSMLARLHYSLAVTHRKEGDKKLARSELEKSTHSGPTMRGCCSTRNPDRMADKIRAGNTRVKRCPFKPASPRAWPAQWE